MRFDLTHPCSHCPFRADITFFLTPARTKEILDALLVYDQTFACHKTTSSDGWDEEEISYYPTGEEQHCAGAMILAERLNRPNQLMRIMERLGSYDRSKLALDAPVFATPHAMLKRMRALHKRMRQR